MGNRLPRVEPSWLAEHGLRGKQPWAEVERADRGQLWQRCLYVDGLKEDEPRDLFQHLLQLPLDHESVMFADMAIQKDLDRVFPHCFGQPRAEYCRKKHSVLLAYAQRCPDIGYDCGLHFIVGVLLSVMDAEDAFWCLCSIVEKMLPPGFFAHATLDHNGFNVEMELFDQLLQRNSPSLSAQFRGLQVDITLYLRLWFKTFFMNIEAPPDMKLRLLDSIFLQGIDGLHNVALLLLKAERSRFLQCSTFEEVAQLLAVLPTEYSSCDFLESALGGPLGPRREELTKGSLELRVRSYTILWSFENHLRISWRRQRTVLVLLMAMKRGESQVQKIPRSVWINWIFTFI